MGLSVGVPRGHFIPAWDTVPGFQPTQGRVLKGHIVPRTCRKEFGCAETMRRPFRTRLRVDSNPGILSRAGMKGPFRAQVQVKAHAEVPLM